MVRGSLRVNGFVRAKGFIQFSDLRLKTNIADIADAMNLLSRIEGKTFVWRNECLNELTGGKKVIGLIAQQVQQIVPEVVHEDPSGFLSVSYSELVPIIIEAFKEHMRQYDTDKKEINDQILNLKDQLAQLETLTKQTAEAEKNVGSTLEPLAGRNSTSSEITDSAFPFVYYPSPGLQHAFKFSETQEKPKSFFPLPILRIVIILAFLIGIGTIVMAAIFLGITISGPDQILTTTVLEAIDLKPMDRDGKPDTFVVVQFGARMHRTNTIWDNRSPSFKETFVS